MKTVLSIQALRAIAALSVAFCHFATDYWGMLGGGGDPGPFFYFGSGVDLFFVISGFVMVYSSEALFGASGAPVTFLRHRLARIVPIYWTATTIWLLTGQPFQFRHLVGSCLFLPYMSGGNPNPLYGVGWTLNFEMFFYAVFAVCLFFRKTAALGWLAGILLVAVAMGRVFVMPSTALIVWTNPLVLEFLAGAGIALFYQRGIILPGLLRAALIGWAIVMISQYRVPEIGVERWLQWGVPAAAIVAASVLGSQRWLEGRVGRIAKALDPMSAE